MSLDLPDSLIRLISDKRVEIMNNELLRYKTLYKMVSYERLHFIENAIAKKYYLQHLAGLCKKCNKNGYCDYDEKSILFYKTIDTTLSNGDCCYYCRYKCRSKMCHKTRIWDTTLRAVICEKHFKMNLRRRKILLEKIQKYIQVNDKVKMFNKCIGEIIAEMGDKTINMNVYMFYSDMTIKNFEELYSKCDDTWGKYMEFKKEYPQFFD